MRYRLDFFVGSVSNSDGGYGIWIRETLWIRSRLESYLVEVSGLTRLSNNIVATLLKRYSSWLYIAKARCIEICYILIRNILFREIVQLLMVGS